MGDTTNQENEKSAGAVGEGKSPWTEDQKGAEAKPEAEGDAYAKGEDRSFEKGDLQGKPGADDEGKSDYQGGEKFAQDKDAGEKADYGDVESGDAPRKDAGYEKGEQQP
jgi:hypothetical protein